MRRINKRGKTVLIILAVLLGALVMFFLTNSGIDFSSKQERDLAATQDAQTALNFALIGEYDADNPASVERVLGTDSFDNFQNNLKKDIKKTFENNAAIADEVEFNGETYEKDDILNQLVDRYLATIWSDKNYTIDSIEYDRYGNTIVNYSVEQIDINQVQQDVQLAVNSMVDNYYPEGADRPTQSKMTLIELALMAEEWNTIVKGNNLTSGDKFSGSFNMNFHRNFRDPFFSIDSGELTKILNSGIVTSQRGN